jgi:hypothetical protein
VKLVEQGFKVLKEEERAKTSFLKANIEVNLKFGETKVDQGVSTAVDKLRRSMST